MEELNGLVSLANCDLLAKRDVLDFLTGGCGVVFDVSVLGKLNVCLAHLDVPLLPQLVSI